MSQDRVSSFVVGLALGVAVGACLALLLAPGTGEETRRRLQDRGPELGNRGRQAARRVLARIAARRQSEETAGLLGEEASSLQE